MGSSPKLNAKIEELRRQLNRGFGSRYDPALLQNLVPISQELDRLTVELARAELTSRSASRAH